MSDRPGELTDSQLHRLIYSCWDFQQALSALTFLMEDCDFEAKYSPVELRRFRCYETNVVVSFARPFDNSPGRTTLSLRSIGIKLTPGERDLKDALIRLRHQIVAHSDEEAMHYRGTTIRPLDDHPLTVPLFQYDEGLHITEAQCRPLEELLRRLKEATYKTLFDIAQRSPDRLERYKRPAHLPPIG